MYISNSDIIVHYCYHKIHEREFENQINQKDLVFKIFKTS